MKEAVASFVITKKRMQNGRVYESPTDIPANQADDGLQLPISWSVEQTVCESCGQEAGG